MFNKVFCIGFNKTGTSSLHRLFTELGLASFHGYYSHIPLDDPVYGAHVCFSDGDRHDFAALDAAFPGSRFILTTRRLDDWLASRIRHVEMRRGLDASGPMRAEYEADPAGAVQAWIRTRLDYHARVVAYFGERPGQLLVIDVCTAPDPAGSAAAIAEFLHLAPPADLRLPHENAQRAPRAAGVRSREEVGPEVEAAVRALGLPVEGLAAIFP